jgi:hypothetical protein
VRIVFPEYAHLYGGCPVETQPRDCSLKSFQHGADNFMDAFVAFR